MKRKQPTQKPTLMPFVSMMVVAVFFLGVPNAFFFFLGLICLVIACFEWKAYWMGRELWQQQKENK